jgi:hypothetical protein
MRDVIAIQPQFWIVPLIGAVLALLGFLWFFVFEERFGRGYGGYQITAIAFWAFSAIFAIISIVQLVPFDSKYHVLFKLSGTVESVTNTLDGGGDGERTTTPVVKLSGYSDPIQMDNPRIVTLKGKEVDLVCSYKWVWQGLDITNCNIREIK